MVSIAKGWLQIVRRIVALLLLTIIPFAAAKELPVITLATAGPGNLSHLPVELIPKIGADVAEGFRLKLRFFGGGPLAYQDLLVRNSDFAVAGMPALADLRAKGEKVVSIAVVNRVPTFTLLVRADLSDTIRTVADLRGRVVGVNTSNRTARSTSQQVAEFLLKRAGVSLEQVFFVPAGQSLSEQQAALVSGSVDALMGDEPFVSELVASGVGRILVDLHDLDTCRRELGGLFLNAQLATREELLAQNPELAQRMVKAVQRALDYIATHDAETIAQLFHPERNAAQQQLTWLLEQHKGIFSPDGAFTHELIATSEAFWLANRMGEKTQSPFSSLIDFRFVGVRDR